MEYKRYEGVYEYDEQAKLFSGRTIIEKDVITFQGNTIEEAEQAFRDSVDDYLEWGMDKIYYEFTELNTEAKKNAIINARKLSENAEKNIRLRYDRNGNVYGILSTNIDFYNPNSDMEDQTQFDEWDEKELAVLWWDFCKENQLISVTKGITDYETGKMIEGC